MLASNLSDWRSEHRIGRGPAMLSTQIGEIPQAAVELSIFEGYRERAQIWKSAKFCISESDIVYILLGRPPEFENSLAELRSSSTGFDYSSLTKKRNNRLQITSNKALKQHSKFYSEPSAGVPTVNPAQNEWISSAS